LWDGAAIFATLPFSHTVEQQTTMKHIIARREASIVTAWTIVKTLRELGISTALIKACSTRGGHVFSRLSFGLSNTKKKLARKKVAKSYV
jgi:hypothetical protein